MKKNYIRGLLVWSLLSLLFVSISAQRISVNGTHFYANGSRIWLNGTNTPWNTWNEFGGSYNSSWWSSHFAALKANHINCTRVWLSCNGDNQGVTISSGGYVSGCTSAFWSNVDNLMSIAQANGIYIMITLISFDHTKSGNTNYTYWLNMYSSATNRQAFADNYAKALVNRYSSNPYLFAIDVGNELDWTWDNQGISSANTVDLITRVATTVHATGIGVLVCQGMGAGIKYNTSSYSGMGNYISGCGVDFWNIHYYDWMNPYFNNPFTVSPSGYGLNDKPCIIGEMPAVGGSGFTSLQCYTNAFNLGYQGAMAWTSNSVDNYGSYYDSKPGTDYIYATYPSLVYPASSGGCTPTTITPYVQVNDGSWQQTSSITVNSGSTVHFGPQPGNGGSWSWSGCGTSGSSREQSFTANSSCTATATYTNSSGCQSTQNFNVTVNGGGGCTPTAIIPYIQVSGGSWQQTGNVTVSSGSIVYFGPQPGSGGSWSWSGCGTSGTSREQSFTANSSCTATAIYTNSLGCQSTQNFNITVNVGSGSNSGNVSIQNRATGLFIDGMERYSNGDNAGQCSGSSSNAQKWTMETSGSNVKFKNVVTGLYLDGMGRNSNGSLTGQWSSNNSSNQQWTSETYGNYKRIKNVATGLYLDGMYWSSNGSDLGQWSGSGSDAQQWTITSLKSARENSEEISSANEGNCNAVLYPNPFISEISLKIDNPEQVTSIVVLDMLGKQVEFIDHIGVKNLQAIGASLKAGIYVVQVFSAGKTQSFKVLKK